MKAQQGLQSGILTVSQLHLSMPVPRFAMEYSAGVLSGPDLQVPGDPSVISYSILM